VLPPITDTGANTFGCLVDGKVFVPQKPAFSSYEILQCNYQLVAGVLYLGLAGRDFVHDGSVSFGYYGYIHGDTVIQFTSPWVEVGVCGQYSPKLYQDYYTQLPPSGELHVTHFDSLRQIISGTFWFNAVDSATKDTVHITDGRFDVHYTR
jgi:hypothetical protein